jgi:subtilase family serine protease
MLNYIANNKPAIFAAIALAILMASAPVAVADSNSSSDFNYIANPPAVQVSPNTIIPNDVPFCSSHSLGTLICYSPNFIRTAYNFPSTLDGTGQTILIVDAFGSPTIQNDLAVFDATFGLPAPPSFKVVCFDGCPTFTMHNKLHAPSSWAVETSLDVEWSHAMAPGANIVLVVAPTSSGNTINSVEAKAISAFPGSIMSQSFGIPEFLLHANNAQLMQAEKNYAAAAAAGITVLASAGDLGATNGIGSPNAGFPSSDPLVTAVGGTQGNPYIPNGTLTNCSGTCSGGLATFSGTCATGPRPGFPTGCTPVGYGGEMVWNEPFLPAATGGAPSLLFGTPSYQGGLGLSSRTTPDVSYDAAVNGGVLVFISALGVPIWFVVGGTSAGSPQWAAIIALANQQRESSGGSPLGFINPTLYKIAESSAYASDFHDITVGNNGLAGVLPGFSAGPGYDDASGWGTPNVANLVSDLASS